MKTMNIAVFIAAATLNALAQGTVKFENNIPGVLVTHVYTVNPDAPVRFIGNGPSDYPPGFKDWTGWIAATGMSFSAQLRAAPGANVDYSDLKPASPITTFQTGANGGFLVPLIATLEGVPADAPVATVMMVAWDNQNGSIDTWEKALYGSPSRWGGVGPINVYNIGGAINPPPILEGLQTFSMLEQIALPEPSSLALLGLGLGIASVLRRSSRRREKPPLPTNGRK